MKKIISMVLALVMVFAIAASASAITGETFDKEETKGVGPYSITDLYLIKNIPTGFGLLSPEKIAAGTAYIANNAIYFAFEFKANATADISLHGDDYKEPWFAITASNGVVEWVPSIFDLYKISNDKIENLTESSNPFGHHGDKKNIVTAKLDGYAPAGIAAQYMIVGGGIVRGNSADTIIAEIMGTESIKFYGKVSKESQFADLFNEAAKEMAGGGKTIYKGKGAGQFVVIMEGITYSSTAPASLPSSGEVTFKIGDYTYRIDIVIDLAKTKGGEDTNVKSITITDGSNTYAVVDTGYFVGGNETSGLYFLDGTTAITSGDLYDKLAKSYRGVMDFFGFKFTQKGILLPSHFAAKFSDFYAYDTVKVPFSSVVVTDPDIELPPTGDAATSIGFVMIALAIVAASAVAYKKVRG